MFFIFWEKNCQVRNLTAGRRTRTGNQLVKTCDLSQLTLWEQCFHLVSVPLECSKTYHPWLSSWSLFFKCDEIKQASMAPNDRSQMLALRFGLLVGKANNYIKEMRTTSEQHFLDHQSAACLLITLTFIKQILFLTENNDWNLCVLSELLLWWPAVAKQTRS